MQQSFASILHHRAIATHFFLNCPLSSKVKGNSMTDNKCAMNGGKMGLNPAVIQRHHSSHLIMNCCVVFHFFLTSSYYYYYITVHLSADYDIELGVIKIRHDLSSFGFDLFPCDKENSCVNDFVISLEYLYLNIYFCFQFLKISSSCLLCVAITNRRTHENACSFHCLPIHLTGIPYIYIYRYAGL